MEAAEGQVIADCVNAAWLIAVARKMV